MNLHPVKSSQIESVGHEGSTLTVKFRNGGTYQYAGVSTADYQALLGAESLGSHLHTHIKGAKDDKGQPKFPHSKLPESK